MATDLKNKGNAEFKLGHWHEAAELYSQAIAKDPKVASLWANRAACWIQLQQWQRGRDDCTQGLQVVDEPTLKVKLLWRKAVCLRELGEDPRDTLAEGLAIDAANQKLLEEHARLGPANSVEIPIQRFDTLPSAYTKAPNVVSSPSWTPPARPLSFASIQALIRSKNPEARDVLYNTPPDEFIAAHVQFGIEPVIVDYVNELVAERGGAQGRALLEAMKKCNRYSSVEFLADERLAQAAAAKVGNA